MVRLVLLDPSIHQLLLLRSRLAVVRLFVEQPAYQSDLALECSVAAYWLEDYEQSRDLSLQLLLKSDLPSRVREVFQKNLSFANAKSVEKIQCGGYRDEDDEDDD